MSTQYMYFDASSMFYACIVQDAVLPSRSCQVFFCPWVPQAERILFVLCSNFDLPGIQSRIDDGMEVDCTSDMINEFEEETVRNNDSVLQSRINDTST